MHVPVLLNETLEYLNVRKEEKYIDATYGMSGHARAIRKKGGQLLTIDRDPSTKPDVIGRFSELEEIARARDFTRVSGILFDLGLGSHQLGTPERGFSFQKEGPLDMRYSPSEAEGKSQITNHKFQTAEDIVNNYSEKELRRIFENFGEEKRFSKKIAKAITQTRRSESLKTTTELFELIQKALPGKLRHRAGDVARRIFQAIRIEVNQELQELKDALPQALRILKNEGPASTRGGEPTRGGRLVVISFHSLEDRIVKDFLHHEARDCICPPEVPVCRCDKESTFKILTKKPVTPSAEEIKKNPRSKSAKLRAAEKI